MSEIITKVADLGEEVIVTFGKGKAQKQVTISTGQKTNTQKRKRFTKSLEKIQASKLKLSPKYDYKDSYKEAYHKMLDEKYGF